MRNFLLVLMAVWALVACGRKEPPQAWIDKGEPYMENLELISAGPSKKMMVTLAGGEGGVGYQLERAEMDPYCQCPTAWSPYHEEVPQRKNQGKALERILRFEISGHYYLYRVRAMDALGRLGAWSQTLKQEAP